MGSAHKVSPSIFIFNCIQVQTQSYWGNCININQLDPNWRTLGLQDIQQNKVGNDWKNGIALLNWNSEHFSQQLYHPAKQERGSKVYIRLASSSGQTTDR